MGKKMTRIEHSSINGVSNYRIFYGCGHVEDRPGRWLGFDRRSFAANNPVCPHCRHEWVRTSEVKP